MKRENKFKVTVICGSFESTRYTKGCKVICTKCKELLWLSNSSVESIKQQDENIKSEEIKTLCLVCGIKEAKTNGTEIKGPNKEQQAEIIEMVTKMRDQHKTHREL